MAVKVQSADILHKTEVGAVALNVAPEDARAAYERVLENAKRFAPTAEIEGVLVQAMAPAGREVIVGISRDECWGPLLMLGLGGVMVEAVRDAVLAPVPLDHEAALALIHRLRPALSLALPWHAAGRHRGISRSHGQTFTIRIRSRGRHR